MDTIFWGEAGNNGTQGIAAQGETYQYDITIDSIIYYHNASGAALNCSNDLSAQCIRLGARAHDWKFDNSVFIMKGRDAQVYRNESGTGSYNMWFDNCVIYDSSQCLTSREIWMASALFANGYMNTKAYSGFDYHFKMTNCSTVVSNWVIVYVDGNVLEAEITDNYFSVDAQNDLGSGFPVSATQCYAIGIRDGASDGYGSTDAIVTVTGNTIRSGTDEAGGRGIAIIQAEGERSPADGFTDSCIYIYNNDISVHQEHDGEYTTCNGILIRQGWRNVWIEDNDITVVGDTSSGAGGYGQGPLSGIRITGMSGVNAQSGLLIRGNHIETYYTGDWTPDYESHYTHTGMLAAPLVFDAFEEGISDVTIDSNYLGSNDLCVRVGFGNAAGGAPTLVADTFAFIDTGGYSGNYTFHLRNDGSAPGLTNNRPIIQDPIFANGATYDSVWLDEGDPSGISSIRQTATVTIVVTDGGRDAINGATVWGYNGYGHAINGGDSGTTIGGAFYDTLPYYYNGDDQSDPDTLSADYNPYVFWAFFGDDTEACTTTVSPTVKVDTIVLTAIDSILTQETTIADTLKDSLAIAVNFSNKEGPLEWVHLWLGTVNPPTADSVRDTILNPTDIDTFWWEVNDGTTYYVRTVAYDGNTTDTSAVVSALTYDSVTATISAYDTTWSSEVQSLLSFEIDCADNIDPGGDGDDIDSIFLRRDFMSPPATTRAILRAATDPDSTDLAVPTGVTEYYQAKIFADDDTVLSEVDTITMWSPINQTVTLLQTGMDSLQIKLTYDSIYGVYQLILQWDSTATPDATPMGADTISSPDGLDDTLSATGLNDGSYYLTTLVVDSVYTDTVTGDDVYSTHDSLSQVFFAINVGADSFQVQNWFIANSPDSLVMQLDDDIAFGSINWADTTASPISPTVATPTSLSANTLYYWRWILYENSPAGYADTSATQNTTTNPAAGPFAKKLRGIRSL
jgi:hypothetical protein